MVYVALFRGINVGSKAKVEMSKLKKAFQDIGIENASSYINSGNIIFEDTRPAHKIIKQIEKIFRSVFKFKPRVLLVSLERMDLIYNNIPKKWTNDKIQKTDVVFLADEIDDYSILRRIKFNSTHENLIYIPGALAWNIDRSNARKGSYKMFINSDIYEQTTIRNINTVRKLHKLMNSIND